MSGLLGTVDPGNRLGALISGEPGSNIRSAIVFTSRLRQIGGLARAQAARGLGTESSASQNLVGEDAAHYMITRRLQEVVAMALNPHTIRMVIPKRIVKRDNRNGSVYFHFTDDKGRNLDVPELQFRGSTGNIDRRGSLSTATADASAFEPTGSAIVQADTGALRRLIAWHNLFQMALEPQVLTDGSQNTVSITMISVLFPVPIEFRGHFKAGIEFEMRGQAPFSAPYNFDFTVEDTDPPLDETLSMISALIEVTVTDPTFVQREARIVPAGVSGL